MSSKVRRAEIKVQRQAALMRDPEPTPFDLNAELISLQLDVDSMVGCSDPDYTGPTPYEVASHMSKLLGILIRWTEQEINK